MVSKGQKASYTVEMALVMPLVFAALMAVFFFVLMLQQEANFRAVINKLTLQASNTITRDKRTPRGYYYVPTHRSGNKASFDYYRTSSYDFFDSNGTEAMFAPVVGQHMRSFNLFRRSTIPSSGQVVFERDGSHIRIESTASYSVNIPFYGGLTSNNTIISTAPEINPTKYIRSVDDAHFFMYTAFDLTSGDITQLVLGLIDYLCITLIGSSPF